ncbi:hypothetical protein CJF32_00003714 [Rutstroemia sp. NJR-2017a WRK4]|nr:hypothetical protein CJF32_00003714 [Rutstroemia sp. NJR-2017a WRK4]
MSYAPIALQATDLLVDKHFHKLPNGLFDKDKYKPSRIRRRNRKRRDQPEEQPQDRGDRDDKVYDNPEIVEPDEPGYQSEPESKYNRKYNNMDDIPRHSGQGAADSQYSYRSNSPPYYSQQPPRMRPEYMPNYQPQTSQQQSDYYFPPPPIAPYPDPRPSSYGRDDRPRRDTSYDQDDHDFYRDQPRRPKPIARRSSYDDLPIRDTHRKDQQLERRKPKSSASGDEGMREKAHRYGVKEEIKDVFTDSPKGLAGGAIGALVGGWAAEKLQEAQTGKSESERSGRSRLITLLGAAAGGLAVNAVVDKWQDDKKKTDRNQQQWDDKWDRNGSRSRDRGEKSRDRGDKDRDRGRGKEERRRRDSVMSYDSRDRHLAYDERTSRSDGRGYDGPNNGYY